jgi:hypothetical protein
MIFAEAGLKTIFFFSSLVFSMGFSIAAGAKVHPESMAVANMLNNNSDILGCYLDSEAGQQKRSDKVILKITLTKKGKPGSVAAMKSKEQTKDQLFRKCVIKIAKKLTYPPPAKKSREIQAKLSFP